MKNVSLFLLSSYLCLSAVSGFHCSNDAPTQVTHSSPEKRNIYDVMPVHLLEDIRTHNHNVHTHKHTSSSLPAPGYPTAEDEIHRALRALKHHSHSSSDTTTIASPVSVMAQEFRGDQIKLLPGGRGYDLQNITLTWLKMFNPDSLLYSFRVTANLSTQGASPYGGWEDPTCLLRGHIAGGHFLSGASLMYNTTGDSTLKTTIDYMIGELYKCQQANSNVPPTTGYLSAFTVDHFERLENNTDPIWAPYYTMHKILRGLYDVYTLTGNAQAMTIANGMLSYFAARIRNVISAGTVAAWYACMNIEFGGMNEVAREWYVYTQNSDALYVAHAFDKPCWLGPLSLGADVTSNMHANTHIPVVIGAAEEYELTGDVHMLSTATGFFDAVSTGHTFATGGSSSGEWWGEPQRTGDQLDINGIESCSTYNILKLSRQLYSWGINNTYIDFFERAKFSGMYGTMHPTLPGRILYLLPLRGPDGWAGGSKAHSYWGYSDPLQSMWCCVGSALESHSKHGDTIFMQINPATNYGPTLLVLLYENAQLTWPVPGTSTTAVVSQLNTWTTSNLMTNVSIALPSTTTFTLALRIPGWAQSPTCYVNGNAVTPTSDGLWFNITRSWSNNDLITLTFPFVITLEHIQDDRSQFSNYMAVIAGPFALGHITHLENLIIGDNSSSTPSWIRPVSAMERNNAMSYGAINAPQSVTFLRHDNETSVWVQPLNLPAGNNNHGGNPTYTLQPPGFLSAGDDLYSGPLTVAEAEAMCTNITKCVGFTFEGTDPNPANPVNMYLKAAADYVASSGWYTYISSRASTSLGGDEDGPDATWITDVPLLSNPPANAHSLRSFNRIGEYLVCPDTTTQCSIAHDTSKGTSNSFNQSATFIIHSPGLTGAANTVSFESTVVPGAYISWYANANTNGTAPLYIVANQPGNSQYQSTSTFDISNGALWLPPTLSYVATTADGSVAGSRNLLMYPVADIVTEWYGVYLQIQNPSSIN